MDAFYPMSIHFVNNVENETWLAVLIPTASRGFSGVDRVITVEGGGFAGNPGRDRRA